MQLWLDFGVADVASVTATDALDPLAPELALACGTFFGVPVTAGAVGWHASLAVHGGASGAGAASHFKALMAGAASHFNALTASC